MIRSGGTVPALLAANVYDSDSASVSGDQPMKPYRWPVSRAVPPMVAVIVPVAVAFADSVADVPDATDRIVAAAGMPVPVIRRPASSSLKEFAGAVMAAEALVVPTLATVRASDVRPATTTQTVRRATG